MRPTLKQCLTESNPGFCNLTEQCLSGTLPFESSQNLSKLLRSTDLGFDNRRQPDAFLTVPVSPERTADVEEPANAPRIVSANEDALPLILSSAEETSSIVFSIARFAASIAFCSASWMPFARPTIMSTPSRAIALDGDLASAAVSRRDDGASGQPEMPRPRSRKSRR